MNKLEKSLQYDKNVNFEKLKNLDIENLADYPDLKRRLEVYISNELGKDAIIDMKHLKMKFNLLRQNDKLTELFKDMKEF
jgi:hypothetical protein